MLARFCCALWQRTAQLFGDFILAERNREIRDNIIDDVTDVLDTIGLESAGYLSSIVAADPASSVRNPVDRALAPLQVR